MGRSALLAAALLLPVACAAPGAPAPTTTHGGVQVGAGYAHRELDLTSVDDGALRAAVEYEPTQRTDPFGGAIRLRWTYARGQYEAPANAPAGSDRARNDFDVEGRIYFANTSATRPFAGAFYGIQSGPEDSYRDFVFGFGPGLRQDLGNRLALDVGVEGFCTVAHFKPLEVEDFGFRVMAGLVLRF